MSDDKKRNIKGLIIGAIFTFVCPLMLLATLFFPSIIENNINKELASMASLIGEFETAEIYEEVLGTSDTLLVQSGVIDVMRDVLLPQDYLNGELAHDNLAFNMNFWKRIDQAIYGFMLNVDFTLIRIYAFKMWIMAMVVFTVASAISGYLLREIKKQGFEYSSPMRHGLGRRMIYTLPVVSLLYLVVPIALPVYFIPIVVVLYSVAIMTVVANTIKRV